MKKLTLLASFTFSLLTINGQTFQWAKRIGGTSTDVALAITTDVTGNVYSTGYFTGTVDIDPGPAVLTFTAPSGSADAFITKFTSAGTLIWAKQVGGSSLEQGNAIKVDAAGNVYVGGTFCTTVDFDPGAGVVSRTVSAATDAFILKLDAAGDFVWVSCFNGTGNEQVTAIDVDASGNVYSTGFWYMTCDFDPGAATYNIQASVTNTNSSAFISKLDNTGAFLWAGEIGAGQFHEGHAIVVDATGNVYVGGHSVGGTDYDPGAGNYNLAGGGGSEAFIVKLTTAGVFITAVKPVGAGDDRLNGLQLDASGNVIATGYFNGTADFDPGAPTANLISGGAKDMFIWKLNASLGYIWAKQIGNTSDDMGNAIMSDASDNVYISGYFAGTVDFDPDAGTTNLASTGLYDAFLLKLNSSGALAYAKKFGSTLNDYGFGVNVDGTGNSIYSVGHFNGTCDFDPDAGVYNLVTAGGQDAFIQKMGFCVVPSAPTSTNISTCYNTSATLTASGTATLGWYTASSGGTYLGAGVTYTTPALTSTTSYYVQDSTCGASTRTQVTVTVNPQITTTGSFTNVSCNGGSNGTATVSVSGGTSPYTYLWAPSGGTAATITGRTSGTYTCTVTDAAGCTRTQTVSITQPTAMTSSISSQTSVSCNGGSNGTATVLAGGGTPGYTYSWSPSGGTAATATGLSAITYTCTITDANSCTRTQTVTIVQPSAITSTVSAQTNVSCNGGNNGSATVSVSGGTPTYTYSWTPSGGTSATTTGRTSGTYTCTITDANGCTRTQTVSITQPTAITSSVSSQTNILCNGGSTGAATITAGGGAGGYTYLWSPSGGTAVTATGLAANTYTCTITDASGCTRAQTVSITQPGAITSSVSSQTNILCNGSSNGAATISATGGTPTYAYLWAPSGGTAATATALAASTYTCTITDANGCTRTQTVSIMQPTAVTTSVSASSNITCNGANDGSASITASGGTPSYSYTWMPSGGNAATASGLSSGTYTCTIADANGCSQSQTVAITEPTLLTAMNVGQSNPMCNAGTDGTASVFASGGTGVITYAWLPSGGNGTTALGIGAGTYTCTITDANGCSTSLTATLTEPTGMTTSVVSQSDPLCNSGTDGAASITASGGAGNYTYNWLPSGGTAAAATGLNAGTYSCVITDGNSCTTSQTVQLSEPTAIASSQTVVLCSGQTLTVGANTYTVTGTYSDIFPAMNGCDSTVTTDLTINNAIDVTTAVNGNTATSNQNGATYQWIDCLNGNVPLAGETNQSLTPAVSGDYAVIVTVGQCSDTSACTNVITGINAVEVNAFSVYPNPTNGVITIQMSQFSSDAQIEVFNALGQLTITHKPTNATSTVVLPEENGIYLVRLTIDGVSTTQKVIKE